MSEHSLKPGKPDCMGNVNTLHLVTEACVPVATFVRDLYTGEHTVNVHDADRLELWADGIFGAWDTPDLKTNVPSREYDLAIAAWGALGRIAWTPAREER